MPDPIIWPDWFQATKLIVVFALDIGFGAHAYRAHIREAEQATSSRRWMYWLYALVFLVVGIGLFVHLLVAGVFRSYREAGYSLELLSLLLILSYIALLAGGKRKT
ncbi:MAG: hypothetical protein GX139_07390 [Armatimonadetes bacterium]|jgi:hypothetical protein|nr:hypothetical protein [Armatimonadota bacterium]